MDTKLILDADMYSVMQSLDLSQDVDNKVLYCKLQQRVVINKNESSKTLSTHIFYEIVGERLF